MIDLDAQIRQGLGQLVDSTPMVPPFDQVARGHRPTPRRRRRAVRVGGGVLAAIVLLGVPAIAFEATDPFARTYQPSDVLTARYGFSVDRGQIGPANAATSSAGVNLVFELERRHGLVETPGEYLPTGPLGPVYAQVVAVRVPGLVDSAMVVVMTVQPSAAAAMARSASGAHHSSAVTVGSHQGRLWRPWSPVDSTVLVWQPSPSVSVLVASNGIFTRTGSGSPNAVTVPVGQLARLAAEVKPLERVPQLEVNRLSREGGSGTINGYWSLVPTTSTRFDGSAWNVVVQVVPALSNLLGNVFAEGTLGGQRWTARVTGDPATGNLSIGGGGVNATTEQPSLPKGLTVVTEDADPFKPTDPSDPASSLRLIDGSVPENVTAVRVVLSNGTTRTARTVGFADGWHRRLFAMALPTQTAYVARVEGLDKTGAVVLTAEGPLPLEGGSSELTMSR